MSRNYLNSDDFRRDAQRDAMADDARNREHRDRANADARAMHAVLVNLLFEIGSVGDRLSHGSPLRNDCEDWCKRIRDALVPQGEPHR